ncbi:uncharacterized protein BYT42DRAFT_589416 [Radiomyces spectabilis]|uniref:uncharacterized protein n=1 Tax=Radiomyces spectabilis TaxID=64574 RepID=UPI0022200932|nr:uncharacterized protein BYT42DRAFT_589416 [Radiomyces spectabilis]KAI8365274.1 hypothetical protein BYT42DRAFT_589416 [Radiomyces spectabilis]
MRFFCRVSRIALWLFFFFQQPHSAFQGDPLNLSPVTSVTKESPLINQNLVLTYRQHATGQHSQRKTTPWATSESNRTLSSSSVAPYSELFSTKRARVYNSIDRMNAALSFLATK